MLDGPAKQLQIAHHELGYRPVLLARREGIIIIVLPITPVPERSLPHNCCPPKRVLLN